MKTKIAAVAILLCLAVSGCTSPLVLQGHVKSYDPTAKTVVIEDEQAPGTEKTFALATAEIGAEPAPGDLVRVSYLEEAGANRVFRLMNLTKQNELSKSGGGH